MPGGKPENESDLECLEREIKEELSGTKLHNFGYYGEFEGKTPHKGDNLKAIVYFADIKGKLGKPSGEIKERKYIKYENNYNLSDITSKILDSLRKDDYL